MAILTESTVEEAALELSSSVGYTILHGPDIAPGELFRELTDYSDVVRVGQMQQPIAAIRDALPPKLISGEIRVNDGGEEAEKAI